MLTSGVSGRLLYPNKYGLGERVPGLLLVRLLRLALPSEGQQLLLLEQPLQLLKASLRALPVQPVCRPPCHQHPFLILKNLQLSVGLIRLETCYRQNLNHVPSVILDSESHIAFADHAKDYQHLSIFVQKAPREMRLLLLLH